MLWENMDDFGLKHVGKERAEHSLEALQKSWKVSTNWEGKSHCGMTLEWDHNQWAMELSMLGRVKAALHEFQHTRLTKPQHAPHQSNYLKRLTPQVTISKKSSN